MSEYRCLVCGYKDYSDEKIESLQDMCSAYIICPCCGTAYDIDLSPYTPGGPQKRIERLRKVWVGRGHKWWASKGGDVPPVDWDWWRDLQDIQDN